MLYEGILVGITSFGVSCGSPWYPGVCTSVVRMLDFIRKHTHIPSSKGN